MADGHQQKESPVETAKRNSRHLRGTIAQALAADSPCFEGDDVHLLKFHGSYQQDDRDQRRQRRAGGLGKAHQLMVRCAIPGGRLTADQYLGLDALADRLGCGSLRITARQGLQLHGILKRNLKATIAAINRLLLTTLGACGDVERNVMACPAPVGDEAHLLLGRLAGRIAEEFRPDTPAYHEIWLDHSKVVSTRDEEPFYGDLYLPRKFKTALATDCDNCVDIWANDCGLIAVVEQGTVRGFNVLVGGGMGMTHGQDHTFARLAQPLGFVQVDQVPQTVRTLAAIFRDHGNRTDRRHARLKYLIAEWGMDRFKDEFRRRAAFDVTPWRALPASALHDHLGPHPQNDGKWFYGLCIENGRIGDLPERGVKTALHTVVSQYQPGVRLTAQQNLLLTDLDQPAIGQIEQTLQDHGVKPPTELSALRRQAMACPALPTCGLALTDSERLMPGLLDQLDAQLAELGMGDVPIAVRMTGCPNGCVRPCTADVAFVGRRPGVYHLYVGGGPRGDRVADLYAADVSADQLVSLLRPLLQGWARHRADGLGLGDYYQRLAGRSEPRVSISGKEDPTINAIEPRALG